MPDATLGSDRGLIGHLFFIVCRSAELWFLSRSRKKVAAPKTTRSATLLTI